MSNKIFLSLEEFLDDLGLDIDTCLYEESITENIKKKMNDIKDDKFIQDEIRKIQKMTNKKKVTKVRLNGEEYREMKSLISNMKDAKSYTEYKSLFNNFCKKTNIPGQSIVITKYDFKKAETGGWELTVSYATSPQKIFIPQGYALYHKTTVNNLTELKPFFAGKKAMGYLYDKPRVYFTIKKDMNNIAADLSLSRGRKASQGIHLYKIDEPIKVAYIDPLLNTYMFGAFYIETNTPVKIIQVK